MIKTRFLLYAAFCIIAYYGCSKKDVLVVKAGDLDYKTLGTSSKALLSTTVYSTLKIEIQYMPGYAPDAAAVNNLVSFLSTYLNKPGGIQVDQKQVAASGATTLTLDQIVNLEKNNRIEFTDGSTIAVHIFIVDADYSLPDILGVSYWNTSMCIFGKLMNANSGNIGQVSRTTFYSTVLEHEFGHLLGLVDLGAAMQLNHKDNTHGYHCTNTKCLMYYGVENKSFAGLLTGNVPSFDANCIADLKANGAK
ncbi:MAG: hypothetical protein ABIO55_03755 [Ginsengibacter sp.]